MIDSGDGVVERMFEHLAGYDWDSFGALLSTGVERIGPLGERVVGRDAYVELMAGGEQRRLTMSAADNLGRSLRRLHGRQPIGVRSCHGTCAAERPRTADRGNARLQIDESGLISGIEVFWRDPRS